MNRPGYARPGYREGRGKRVKRMKVYKKMRMVDLVDAIRSVLQAPIPRRRPASDMNLQVLSSGVMKEELAHRFSVPEHQVAHALHILGNGRLADADLHRAKSRVDEFGRLRHAFVDRL